jgi:hypothetical protein
VPPFPTSTLPERQVPGAPFTVELVNATLLAAPALIVKLPLTPLVSARGGQRVAAGGVDREVVEGGERGDSARVVVPFSVGEPPVTATVTLAVLVVRLPNWSSMRTVTAGAMITPAQQPDRCLTRPRDHNPDLVPECPGSSGTCPGNRGPVSPFRRR